MPVLALLIAAAAAAAPVASITWSDATRPAGATLVPDGAGRGRASIRIVNPGPSAAPLRVALASFRGPAVATPYWSVRGRVRTESVTGSGFLEMWSTFPDGSSFFSRTLSSGGTMRSLEGTQAWREFTLPFRSEPGHPAPVELKVNVVLPGAGTVELGPLELDQHDSPAGLLSGTAGWFTGAQAGFGGSIVGAVLGVLGAAIGWLSSRGRGRSLVLGALVAMMAFGAVCLAATGLAVVVGQPRDVWLSLALFGVVCSVVPASVFRSTAARYRDVELRRMQAIDA